VVTPTYRREPQMDPWIVGEVDDDRFAVIAHWD
jgi:hypothetical protein